MTRTIWGREPAVFWSLVATLVQALLLLFPWSDEVHGALNALTLAVAGVLTAGWVSVDAALPLLAGVFKAVLAVVLAFGVHVPDQVQVAILAVVSAVVSLLVRQQVTAQVPALDARASDRM